LDKKFDNIELDMKLLNLLSGALMPILQNDIEEVFLDKLIELTHTDFHSNMAKLHEKVKEFSIFRQRFVVYLRWLVKQVFILVSESWNKGLIDKFEAIIFRDLNNYGFNKIQSKLNRLEIENEDTNKVKNLFSKQEIEFFKRNNINTDQLRSRWAWIEGNHVILENYFKEIIIPYFNHVPSSSELKKNGYARLVKYIYSIYPNYKQFVSKVLNEEYKPYYRKISYDTINKIKQITGSYVNSFLRNNKFKLPPTISYIIEENKLGITPNTFKNHALKYLEYQFGKENGNDYFFQMWGSAKISPYKIDIIRETVQKAIKVYEKEKIKPQPLYRLSKKLDISWRTFSRHTRDYLEETYNKAKANLLYNTLWDNPEIENLPKAKLELINSMTNSELDLFRRSNKLYDPISIAELSSIEELKIKPDTFRKHAKRYLNSIFGKTKGKEIFKEMWPGSGQNISRQLISNIEKTVQIEIDKFLTHQNQEQISTISNLSSLRGINVSSATFSKYAKEYINNNFGTDGSISYSELWPNDINILKANAGRIFHLLLNYNLTSFFNEFGILYFSEIPIYPKSRRPDGLIIIEEENKVFSEIKTRLLSILQINFPIFQGLKAIVFDFTSDISGSNIIRKIKKYQNSEILLFIVGYRWYFNNDIRPLSYDKRIIYPRNIYIINLDLFFKIFEVSPKFISKINIFKDFALNYDLTNLNKLKLMEKIVLNDKAKLKNYLKKKLLINENITEFFPYGIREYPSKDSLNSTEMEEIKKNHITNRIAIIDIETTSYIKKDAFIVEIGIVELDYVTGAKKILFNSPIYEKGVENYSGMGVFGISNLDLSDVKNSKNLESYRETLQFIFDRYRITSFNTNFDLSILESKGFIFPKKLMDLMNFTRKMLPQGKYNFEFAYRQFYNSKENNKGKYLKNKNYEEQHRAIDDAIHEAELLFLFIHKFDFPTSFQSHLKINKS
ncbi:MAG: 3'-5' exonuclease, partial [Promethearchaeota archaeon]